MIQLKRQLIHLKTKTMKTLETYIANGKIFRSYEDVIAYNKENNYRVTGTNTIRGNTHIIYIGTIN